MSRSGDRQWRRVIISLAAALVFSVVALATSGLVASQTLELQEKISVVDEVGAICGPAGLNGEPGSEGEAGPCGPVGAAGPCGPTGETGQPGATGESGATGAQGEKGDTGATGAQGEKGDTGATGAQGEKGDTGATGPRGEKGDTGAAGSTGLAGADGITTLGHHGGFYDTTDQLNTFPEPKSMRLNTSDPSNCGVYVDTETTSRIYVTRDGTYNLQFSAQIRSNANQTKPVDIWLAKNGEPVPATNTQFFAPDRKGIYIAAWNFLVPMTSGDYLELKWYSADGQVYLSQLPEQTELGIPAVPSLIVTLTQVG